MIWSTSKIRTKFLSNKLLLFSESKGHSSKNSPDVKERENETGDLKTETALPFKEDECINNHDLYNILNDGAMKMYLHDPYNVLVIDGRSVESFNVSHVITAKHHTIKTKSSQFLLQLSSYGMVIIHGENLRNSNISLDFLVSLKKELQEYLASDVLVLVDGFDAFAKEYPFLCTDKMIETVSQRKELTCYPSMILDKSLFQGRGDQATNERIIDLLKITHIVNITLEHQNGFPNKVKYLRLELDDVSDSNLFEHFHKTSDFIHDALTSSSNHHNNRVLVHCNLGVSRSSTITLAYLIKHKKWNLKYAFQTLKSRRSCASPNEGFQQQLLKWESEILGQNITSIKDIF